MSQPMTVGSPAQVVIIHTREAFLLIGHGYAFFYVTWVYAGPLPVIA